MTLQWTPPLFLQGDRYEEIAQRFRPVFARIRQGAVERDAHRRLPTEEIEWLKAERFGALRLDEDEGGHGASLVDLFRLLVELAQADSNLAQIFRGHFGFVETLLFSDEQSFSRKWRARVAAGELVSPAWTEPGDASWKGFSTALSKDGDRWRVNGKKFYTTGTLFSEWTSVGVRGPNGETVLAIVSTKAPGVTVVDDWNGFGQILTGSGTAVFDAVEVSQEDVIPVDKRLPYQTAFYQVVHLATISGIGLAASQESVHYIAQRKRTFSHGAASVARQDPQVLQLLGNVNARVSAAATLSIDVARHLQQAYDAAKSGLPIDVPALEIAVYQAQIVVVDQVLQAVTTLFNGLGASALGRELGFDRFWRNARTVSSHNPVIYKERIVGDFLVNGAAPPEAWLAGVS